MFPNTYSHVKGSTTRPADTTAYASGDLVANSTTAGSVVAITLSDATSGGGAPAVIKRVNLRKSGTGVTNASFRVHLFTAAPTVANGDNGAISMTGAANYVGQVDVTVGQTFTDGAHGAVAADYATRSGTLYALIEARGAYTPASAEVFTLCLEMAQK